MNWSCRTCGRTGETPEGVAVVFHRCIDRSDEAGIGPRTRWRDDRETSTLMLAFFDAVPDEEMRRR